MKPRTILIGLAALAVLAAILACNIPQATTTQPAGTSPSADVAKTSLPVTSTSSPQESLAPDSPAGTAPVVTPQPDLPTEVSPGDVLSTLRVVYIKEGNAWMWTQAGGPQQLTTAGGAVDARISDDGLIVAFLRQVGESQTELWAVNTDASEERRLAGQADLQTLETGATEPNVEGREPYSYNWLPGTHTVAFNTRMILQGPGLLLSDDLRMVNADTLDLTTFLNPGEGGEFYFSPDGAQIVLTTPTKVSLINVDGSDRRDGVLNFEPILTMSEYQYYPLPTWAPDSGSLRVAIPPVNILEQADLPTTIWHLPADGSPAVQLSQIPAGSFLWSIATFSPDLGRIAFVRLAGDPAANERALHIVNADGSGEGIYQQAPFLEFEGWAPDSTRFLFAIGEDLQMQLGQLGGPFAPLVEPAGGVDEVKWIDAQQFFYRQAGDGFFEIRLKPLTGESILLDRVAGPPPAYDFIY